MTETRAVYRSSIEHEFIQHLTLFDVPYEEEYMAVKGRRFRWDFYTPPDLLIELNGGTYQHMGHSTGKGIQRDYDKHNLAVLNGFRVLMFTTDDVTSGRAIETVQKARKV